MLKYVKLSNDLYLVEQEVQKSEAKASKDETNHIWIYDRSGSMSWSLPQLAQDLIHRAKGIPTGDTLTLGWFSGEGSFNFMLKGFKITESKDYKILEETINRNKSALGTTCFSEILADTNNVIKDLSSISNRFALCFFTDGYPVVSNYTKEITNISTAIEQIQGKVTASLLVGYGNYYNKELMSSMAQQFGGSLTHSEDLPKFSFCLNEFIEGSRGSSKTLVEIDSNIKSKNMFIPYNICNRQINVYAPQDGKINFAFSKNKKDYLYVLTDLAPKNAKEEEFTDTNLNGNSKTVESLAKGAYAAAYILTQRTKTDKALEVLSTLGEVNLINVVNNAFTNAEYGVAESRIQESMAVPSKRFQEPRNTKYLPSSNAFCLLDLLDLLMQDEDAYFYPTHEEFSYNKIGLSSKAKEDSPKFTYKDNVKCSLGTLTWNSKKLNLSILAKIEGTIKLKEGYKDHGFAEDYPTWIFRNYTLVKDGFLNIKNLPITMSKETYKQIQDKVGMIALDGIYLVDLTSIPVINRAISDGKTSATKLCKDVLEESKLEANLKVLRYYKNELESKDAPKHLSEAQAKFLEENSIGKNGFSPASEKSEATDFYMAKEFDIKIKGFSSLPKVTDVEEKMKKASSLSGPSLYMSEQIQWYNGLKQKDSVKVVLVNEAIDAKTKELVSIRSQIQKTKFAVLLGKKWFDEFSSREENKLTVDKNEFTITLREVKVEV